MVLFDPFLPTCFQEDAVRHLQMLEKEIQDSMDELDKISPLYDNQVIQEKDITKRYDLILVVYFMLQYSLIVCL